MKVGSGSCAFMKGLIRIRSDIQLQSTVTLLNWYTYTTVYPRSIVLLHIACPHIWLDKSSWTKKLQQLPCPLHKNGLWFLDKQYSSKYFLILIFFYAVFHRGLYKKKIIILILFIIPLSHYCIFSDSLKMSRVW